MFVSAIMDVSQLQSGTKGSSDFSIERILSEDPKSVREDGAAVESPSWLCCTRYRPPRLPRAVSSNACRARRSGRHARVPFTAAQASALEAAYERAPYLAPPALRALAAALQLRDDRIKIWFQNRRARERREKCVNITPPHSVTLPPTTRAAATGALGTKSPWIPQPACSEVSASVNNPKSFDMTTEIRCMPTETARDFPRTALPFSLPISYNQNLSLYDENESSSGDRSETPLDIETVEE